MAWISMSERDLRRIEVLSDVRAGRRTVAAAAAVLAVSERQAYRLLARYEVDGGSGLIHKARGRTSNRSRNEGIRKYAVELVKTRYADFGPTLAPTDHLVSSASLVLKRPASLAHIKPDTILTLTATVTGSGGVAPTGVIDLLVSNLFVLSKFPLVPGKGNTSTATFALRPGSLLPGNDQVSVAYAGDTRYAESTSNSIVIRDDPSDFTIQALQPNLVVVPGKLGKTSVNLAPLDGFKGTVTLACTVPEGLICVPAPPFLQLSGSTTATILISAPASGVYSRHTSEAEADLAAANSGAQDTSGNRSTPHGEMFKERLPAASYYHGPGIYTAVVTATGSNGLVHNTTLTITVQ